MNIPIFFISYNLNIECLIQTQNYKKCMVSILCFRHACVFYSHGKSGEATETDFAGDFFFVIVEMGSYC